MVLVVGRGVKKPEQAVAGTEKDKPAAEAAGKRNGSCRHCRRRICLCVSLGHDGIHTPDDDQYCGGGRNTRADGPIRPYGAVSERLLLRRHGTNADTLRRHGSLY